MDFPLLTSSFPAIIALVYCFATLPEGMQACASQETHTAPPRRLSSNLLGMATRWLLLTCCSVVLAGDFTLTVLHTNDVHSHFLETSPSGGRCKQEKKETCVGGVARHLALVRKMKASNPNTLFLNAGDYFQGTAWYTLLKYRPVADVVQLLAHDAMCLGNHEFDDGPGGLEPFLKALKDKVPVLAANADFSADEILKDRQVNRSVTLVVGSHHVGIVGAVTKNTEHVSNVGGVTFTDELEAIRKEAQRLKKSGVNIVIAVTHCGYAKEQQIAKEVPEVSLIVGGHSHTFLFSGSDYPAEDTPQGPYPTVVNRVDGTKGLVVQAYWFGKYMGLLNVTYDENGNILKWSGRPLLLDHTYPKDPEMERLLDKYETRVTEEGSKDVGSSRVLLDGRACRDGECNMGNLITDALFDYYSNRKTRSNSTWSDVNGAMIVGGTIRGSISQTDHVIMEDLLTVMPYGNTISIITLDGDLLKRVFEHSIRRFNFKNHPGEFLQVSGLHVKYDMSKPPLERVSSLEAICTNCTVPRYEAVVPDKWYRVVTYLFTARGGDGFNFSKAVAIENLGDLDLDVFRKYLTKISPIKAKVEGRIIISEGTVLPGRSSSACPHGLSSYALAIAAVWSLRR
ncbi:protein 5NUC-like [Ornithodoros turicata]|uniref:protein 5NUC-like n=1 Tax=Ornithodoros turicata TaxID=34597 RepID=UPI003138DA47